MTQFILISIVFLVYEFGILLNPKKIINLKKKLDEVKNLEGDQKTKMSSEIISSGLSLILFNLFYFSWLIIGLIIYQHWYLFFFIIFLSFFSSFITKQILFLDKPIFYYKIFETILSIIVLLLILISFFYPNLYNNLIF